MDAVTTSGESSWLDSWTTPARPAQGRGGFGVATSVPPHVVAVPQLGPDDDAALTLPFRVRLAPADWTQLS